MPLATKRLISPLSSSSSTNSIDSVLLDDRIVDDREVSSCFSKSDSEGRIPFLFWRDEPSWLVLDFNLSCCCCCLSSTSCRKIIFVDVIHFECDEHSCTGTKDCVPTSNKVLTTRVTNFGVKVIFNGSLFALAVGFPNRKRISYPLDCREN